MAKEKKQNRPHILDKKYSEAELKKKILSKIEVPEDKALMSSLFVKGLDPKKPDLYAAPEKLEISKKDLDRVRKIAKEIHARSKSRVNFAPLIAVVVLLFALFAVINVFKNPLAKKIIVSSMEGIFGAKTEVQSVNISFLGASVTVKNLSVGNKDSVMKNLFEAEVIEVDFNLTQALRGKFDAENLQATGILVNTDRSTSCELPKKEKKEEKKENPFVQKLNAAINKELESLKNLATELLGGDDIESIVSNIQGELKTPAAVEKGISEVDALVQSWNKVPEEITKEVSDFSVSVQDLQTINVNKIQDEAVLRDALVKITKALAQGNTLKTKVDGTLEKVHGDSKTVKEIQSSVKDAVTQDKNLAKKKLTAIVDTASNSKTILTNALDSVAYSMVGKMYPFAKQVISFAEKVKKSAAMESAQKLAKANKAVNEKTKEITKPKKERLTGTTFWYNKEYPAFLIEKASFSGPGFSASASDISSNPNLRNKPCLVSGTYEHGKTKHSAKLMLDARTETENPLITIDYTGEGFALEVKGEDLAQKSGVPSLSGKALLSLHGEAGSGVFVASGDASLNPVSLSSDGFSSEHMTKYYNQALSSVKKIDLGYGFDYHDETGVNLSLTGNYSEVFKEAMSAVVKSIGSDAKVAALEKINNSLNDSSNEMLVKAKEFFGIEGNLDAENVKLSKVQELLEKKKAEVQERLTAIAKQAVDQATQQAKDTVKSELQKKLGADEELSNKATEKLQGATGGAIKNLLGGKK